MKNFLYNRKLLPVYRGGLPVVAVGGLELGGSGKTPVLLAVTLYFLNKGMNVAVIARGYRRKTKGIRCLRQESDWKEFGDEAYLIWKKTHAPVVVGKKWKAARWAAENLSPDLLLVDDGFQHRRLARTVDVVVSSDWESLKKGRLFPAGSLREPVKNVGRAHLWLLRQSKNPKVPYSVPAFPFSYELSRARLWPERREAELEALRKKKLFIFAGIGQPENLLESAKSWKLSLAGWYFLPDHHPYTQAEVDWIVAQGRLAGADFLATTEKDAVRLAGLSFPDFSLVVLEMDCKIETPDYFFRKLEDRLYGRTFV